VSTNSACVASVSTPV